METLYHIPENEQMMDEIYAVSSIDEKVEGIFSMMGANGAMPMVFGHPRMIELIKPFVNRMARDTGKTLRLVKYKKEEIMEVFG